MTLLDSRRGKYVWVSMNLNFLIDNRYSRERDKNVILMKIVFFFLGVLGIPFVDVVRVLAAVLLLGNVQFVDSNKTNKNHQNHDTGSAIKQSVISEVSVIGEAELNAVAALLGVPMQSLFRGVTSRTHNTRAQLVKSFSDANMVSYGQVMGTDPPA